jgi:hypothetical protein
MAISETILHIQKRLTPQVFIEEFNLRHYSVVNDLNLSSRYLINVSQIPEDALKQRRLQAVYVFHIEMQLLHCIKMWIIPPEVHYCTVEQVSHF